jgi:hypothetical protein
MRLSPPRRPQHDRASSQRTEPRRPQTAPDGALCRGSHAANVGSDACLALEAAVLHHAYNRAVRCSSAELSGLRQLGYTGPGWASPGCRPSWLLSHGGRLCPETGPPPRTSHAGLGPRASPLLQDPSPGALAGPLCSRPRTPSPLPRDPCPSGLTWRPSNRAWFAAAAPPRQRPLPVRLLAADGGPRPMARSLGPQPTASQAGRARRSSLITYSPYARSQAVVPALDLASACHGSPQGPQLGQAARPRSPAPRHGSRGGPALQRLEGPDTAREAAALAADERWRRHAAAAATVLAAAWRGYAVRRRTRRRGASQSSPTQHSWAPVQPTLRACVKLRAMMSARLRPGAAMRQPRAGLIAGQVPCGGVGTRMGAA